MKNMIKAVISVPVTLLFSAGEIFRHFNSNGFSDDMMLSVFGTENIDELFLQGFCTGCVIPLVFAVIFGMYFYHGLQIGSVYIFTRQKSRLKWYAKHCLSLIMYSVIYSLLFVLTKSAICFGFSAEIFNRHNIVLELGICLSSIQIGIIGALIINFFVIIFGSSVGYLVGSGANVALLGVGFLTRFSSSPLMLVDPFTAYIRSFYEKYSMAGFMIQLVSMVIFMFLGYLAVRNMNIGLNNKEI